MNACVETLISKSTLISFVALGAAVQAGTLAGAKATSILVDITPHTFSKGTIDTSNSPFGEPACSPVIIRNTPLPARKAEVFYTPGDDLEYLEFPVFQGESSVPAQNTQLCQFEIHDLRGVRSGSPVLVEFSLDLNGMLTEKAIDRTTGKSKQIVLDTRSQGQQFDVEGSRARLGDLEHVSAELMNTGSENVAIEPADRDESGEIVVLRKRAEKLLKGDVSDDDRSDIESSLQRLSEAETKGDEATLLEEASALDDVLFYLEE